MLTKITIEPSSATHIDPLFGKKSGTKTIVSSCGMKLGLFIAHREKHVGYLEDKHKQLNHFRAKLPKSVLVEKKNANLYHY